MQPILNAHMQVRLRQEGGMGSKSAPIEWVAKRFAEFVYLLV